MATFNLTWDADGLISEQRYYCSLTPMDPNSLPTPKAILDGSVRAYSDTAVTSGYKYYVRLSTVKGEVEKVSDELIVNAQYDIVRLKINSGALVDEGTPSKTWANNGNYITYTAPSTLTFDGSTGRYLTTGGIDLSGDFEISGYFKIPTSASRQMFKIFANSTTWSGNVFSITVAGANHNDTTLRNKVYIDSPNASLFLKSTTIVTRDVEYKFALRKEAGYFKLLINDVVEATIAAVSVLNTSNTVIGAWIADNNAQQFVGTLRDFKIKRL